MKQVLRKGLKEIVVDEVPDPVVTPHHVIIRPSFSLISSGTETASIHTDSLLTEVIALEAGTFTPLGSIALNAVRTAAIGIGDNVVVIGLGLVGQLITQLVRSQGGVVIGVDLKTDGVERARKLGADHAVLGGSGPSFRASSTRSVLRS